MSNEHWYAACLPAKELLRIGEKIESKEFKDPRYILCNKRQNIDTERLRKLSYMGKAKERS